MWFALFACQAPFGTDRHDLVGFRVAAIAVPPAAAGATLVPEAAIVVDGRTWSDDPVDLLWYWVPSADAVLSIDPVTPIDGFGPAPSLVVPADPAILALRAVHGADEELAFIEIAPPPPVLDRVFSVGAESLPLAMDALEGPELLLEARQELTASPLDTIEPGDIVRLTANVADDPLVRWMATAGTFFELERQVADWAAGDLTLDGDQIEDGWTVLDPGPVTFIALALGNPGETAFSAVDLTVGPHGDGVIVNGRLLPTDVALDLAPGDGVAGTLVADDDSPTGLALAGATVVDPDLVPPGTDALPCAAVLEGPFDPRVLLDAICTRSAVLGFDVVVVPERTW